MAAELCFDELAEVGGDGKPAAQRELAERLPRFRGNALDSRSARTWLLVGSHSVLAYCALASGTVPLSRRQRASVGSAYRTTPATLMAWAAKAVDADVDGQVIVEHAASMAMRVRRFQGNCVLALDAFDDEVATIWKGRYGFWDAAPPNDPAAEPTRRLWISLDAFSR